MSPFSMEPLWGGSSFMDLYLRVLKYLVDLKKDEKWMWDSVINLSETDYPINFFLLFCLTFEEIN